MYLLMLVLHVGSQLQGQLSRASHNLHWTRLDSCTVPGIQGRAPGRTFPGKMIFKHPTPNHGEPRGGRRLWGMRPEVESMGGRRASWVGLVCHWQEEGLPGSELIASPRSTLALSLLPRAWGSSHKILRKDKKKAVFRCNCVYEVQAQRWVGEEMVEGPWVPGRETS